MLITCCDGEGAPVEARRGHCGRRRGERNTGGGRSNAAALLVSGELVVPSSAHLCLLSSLWLRRCADRMGRERRREEEGN